MGIFAELAKSKRNREAYKAQVVKQERLIQDKDREIKALRRRLANVEEYCRRALA